MKKQLVLFDFDGTLTTKDTLLEFIRFYHGYFKFISGVALLSPWLVLFVLKLIPNWKAKEKVLQWFFKGEPVTEFNKKSEAFCKHILPKLIRPSALAQVKEHIDEGASVVVISASAENWVRPWCATHNLECLATELEIKENSLTGKIKGFNCYGPEKARRIKDCYNLDDFEEVIAYGDSRGDKEMLALAHKKIYKPFRQRQYSYSANVL